jgi:branched-chain amino acid transport system ATP-binding protein
LADPNINVPILQVENLTRYFGGLAAVKDVSFEVHRSQIFGIIGPNGAGKTTLFSMIAGALRPSSGEIRGLGKNTTREPSHRLVKTGIARTHQIVRPFRALTVLENVQIGVYFGRKPPSGSAGARESAL